MTPSFHLSFSLNGPLELNALLAWVGCFQPTDDAWLLSAIQRRPTFDWSYLLELAGRHNLKPLLYHRLKTRYTDQIPASVLHQLGTFYRANAAKNLAMSNELGRVLKAFGQSSIEGLAFKGPTLSQLAYGSVARRQFGDLDLLIKKNELCQASGLLEELGYRPQFKLTPLEQARYARLGYEATFWHETSGHESRLALVALAPDLFFLTSARKGLAAVAECDIKSAVGADPGNRPIGVVSLRSRSQA